MVLVVLDTNVVSELMRAAPDPVVLAWVAGQQAGELTTTAVTVAEVRYGIARLPPGRRRDGLRAAADDVFGAFADKVLPFDAPAAASYGDVVTAREQAGAPISGFDAQIAAVCRARGAVLATRNTADFTGTGLVLVDPWRHGG